MKAPLSYPCLSVEPLLHATHNIKQDNSDNMSCCQILLASALQQRYAKRCAAPARLTPSHLDRRWSRSLHSTAPPPGRSCWTIRSWLLWEQVAWFHCAPMTYWQCALHQGQRQCGGSGATGQVRLCCREETPAGKMRSTGYRKRTYV
jgi:hypothetical protein